MNVSKLLMWIVLVSCPQLGGCILQDVFIRGDGELEIDTGEREVEEHTA